MCIITNLTVRVIVSSLLSAVLFLWKSEFVVYYGLKQETFCFFAPLLNVHVIKE